MKVIVIGAGAAGCLAAYTAAKQGNDVTVIEKNEKIGKKLYITGKGRCNLTNDCDAEEFLSNVVSNPRFLTGAIYSFAPKDTMELFSRCGLKLKTERGNRVFPASDKSSDVIKTLEYALKNAGVKLRFNENVTSLIIENGVCLGVQTTLTKHFADAIVVATGGASYDSTGSTGDGYRFAAAAGHTINTPVPALAPINTRFGYRDLAGLSLKNVTLKAVFDGKQIAAEFGEMLFTHEGVSGPIVLTISSKINRLDPDKVKLFIDFKPALSEDTLDKRVIRDFDENPTRQVKNSFAALLP
ncbi:MAG: aminoacetone oxidase family FAD-binding enzyme [Clostridia bacterium]|nr:aminoacetone oxidase family FAD-binding enzyme [Clostridia bacterium]